MSARTESSRAKIEVLKVMAERYKVETSRDTSLMSLLNRCMHGIGRLYGRCSK